jgi:hypothetical protein
MLKLDASRCEDGFVLVADRHALLDQHVWVTWVAGLWHHAEETQDPSFAPGEALVLEAEPDNPIDVNAIGIWNADHSLTVGYVGRWEAAAMTPAHRVGVSLLQRVEDGKRTGLLIVVSRSPVELVGVTLDPTKLLRLIQQLPRMPTPHPATMDPVEAMWQMVGRRDS